ncbi:ectoine/hydroxyectoine ABC transporter permease subunit EhuD [Brachybacterium sp. AOP43-C2-M15]|uniref:ectoine/hydroxyectoine ABC transporter permease subunit EhuD n=1 Tax=Brachybacterium sp. AOP43-C2-M15 TaxID=3457661 RepID=UPI0040347608
MTPTNTWWSWDHAFEVLPKLLLEGFKITLFATVMGTLIALVLGLIVAIIRRSAPAIIATPFTWVVEFIRMTPLVVQLVFANLVLSPYINSTLAIGIGVLGVHYMTYMAEVYRAGIDSVPKGQWEAATALSLPQTRTWRAVVIPQAIRNTLPALGNYAISMFKETPFFFVIYIPELVRVAQTYGGQTFRFTESITLAGLIFLVASYPTSLLIRRLEKKLA